MFASTCILTMTNLGTAALNRSTDLAITLRCVARACEKQACARRGSRQSSSNPKVSKCTWGKSGVCAGCVCVRCATLTQHSHLASRKPSTPAERERGGTASQRASGAAVEHTALRCSRFSPPHAAIVVWRITIDGGLANPNAKHSFLLLIALLRAVCFSRSQR